MLKYALILLLLFFIGCIAKEKIPEENKLSDYEKWEKLAEYTQAYSPTPRAIDTQEYKHKTKSEHLAEIQTPVIKKEKKTEIVPDKRLPTIDISMQMHEVEVGLLFRTLAKSADVNLILNKSITGKASLNIQKVPWNQVFKGLLNTYGYTYFWMEDIIRVVSIQDLKTQASLKNAKQLMELKDGEHDIALTVLSSEKERTEPLNTRVVHVEYADPVELRDNLWEFLTVSKSGYQDENDKTKSSDQIKNRGAITVDKHTNSLMIQSTSKDMITILELMEKLDKPTPQVRIEAFIVETTSETARELGMQWGGLLQTGKGFTKIISGPGLEDVEDSISDLILSGSGLKIGNISQNLDSYLLNIQLSALQREGKLNILSSPSITTLDNQKAIIESGREIPYTTSNDGENSVQFKKAVLKLEATPHVMNGNNLKIKIVTNKDELDFSTTIDGNPGLLTKYAETEVVLQDGQTTVIGGLGKETQVYGETGIPKAKDIPFLGFVFKQENSRVLMEDILIFITPHILKQRATDTTEIKKDIKDIKGNDKNKNFHFSLQVGVFANKQNADRLSALLTQKGYTPYLYQTVNSKNLNLYSVRIKDFLHLKAAFNAETEYRKKENKPAIVTFYNMLDTVPRKIKSH